MARGSSNGYSIHIGLNGVDPDQYNGWPGTLAGCINDAKAMQKIASSPSLGYDTTMLTDEEATAEAVLDALSNAADICVSGDILLLTYSGHGGQIDDVSGDEPDSQDETWVLYNRMLLDDELYAALGTFAAGVRIFVLSDSCHSGTVLREVYTQLPQFQPLARAYNLRPKRGTRELPRTLPAALRRIPEDVQAQHVEVNQATYVRLKRAAKETAPEASVILISGCQDNQLSADGTKNGLFTEKLLQVWSDGAFAGDYPTFHHKIVEKMPSTQSPNYFKVGVDMPAFDAQKPFTVGAAATTASVSERPSVSGPSTIDRADDPPTFDVVTGSNEYYVFEITSDPQLFNDGSGRTTDNFYATWDDSSAPSRLSESTYTLSQDAWDRLKNADQLWFRIGTTSSETDWDNYTVSTDDDQGDSAPSLQITDVTTEPLTTDGKRPSVSGPSTIDRAEDPPTFDVVTGSNEYYVFEITSDPQLFNDSSGRTTDNFYATWDDSSAPSRLSESTFTLSQDAWDRLKNADQLWFRIGTTSSETDWDNYTVSTDDDQGDSAPSLELTGERVYAGASA